MLQLSITIRCRFTIIWPRLLSTFIFSLIFIRPAQPVEKPKSSPPVEVMDNFPTTNEKTQEAQHGTKVTEKDTEDDSGLYCGLLESDKNIEDEKMYSDKSDKENTDLDKDEVENLLYEAYGSSSGDLKEMLRPSESPFTRYIRSLPYDLLALQETHPSSHFLYSRFYKCLQLSYSIWTQHCGLLSFNPILVIESS
ncbi:hypothetical protein G6F56_002293 [Rhizopus delemar]|nr:hypothetical protein G6F56_002293 [Rhizopus delemar]